jgi:hypothetical protein
LVTLIYELQQNMSANEAISASKENSYHERKPLKFWETMWREYKVIEVQSVNKKNCINFDYKGLDSTLPIILSINTTYSFKTHLML